MSSPLLRNDNRFLRQTEWMPRPDRRLSEWRYVPEGELLAAVDQWDAAENHRRQVDQNVAALTAKAKLRDAEAEKVRQAREDQIVDDELKRRFLAGGGTEEQFITNHRKIRTDFATAVAIGQAKPIMGDLDQLKQELRAIRAGRNLGAADPRP